MHEYDKSSKWLIQHHGDSILRLAGVRGIVSWRPLHAEVVQSRRLPDGLLEAKLRGESKPALFVLELSSYPYHRLTKQVARDMMAVFLDRGVLPEMLSVILHPRGRKNRESTWALASQQGWSRAEFQWKMIELWMIPAAELLEAQDVGLIPWVPLTKFDDSPTPIFRECRRRIDRDAPGDEHDNLLAVTQVLAGLRYNDPKLFQILGGRKAMIESPVLKEFIAENTRETLRKAISGFLIGRFGPAARKLQRPLELIEDESELAELVKFAGACSDVASFQARLGAGSGSPNVQKS
jgi:hypothetical protein